MTTWNFNFIKARCYKAPNHDADAVLNEGDGDDQGGDDNDDEIVENNSDLPATRAVGIDSGPSSSTAGVSKSCVATTVKASQRYTHAKKLFDEIAAGFASKALFSSFVDILRAVIVTTKSGDPDAGFARIRSYITVDARLQKPPQEKTKLLPAVIVKEGRKKNSSRGKMIREMRTSAPQCSFCLSRNPIHRVGSKCKALMAKGMNVELNAQNFPLLSTRTPAPDTNLAMYTGPCKPVFVHVTHKSTCAGGPASQDVDMSEEASYICTLYVHAAECLGTYLVRTTTLADWTAQTNCRVFISGTHELPKPGLLSNPKSEKRKETSMSTSTISGHVSRLQSIWTNRAKGGEETWLNSRIGRITGTTAKIVMTGKNKPSGQQLAQIFGFTTFEGTTKMQIGSILEPKILDAYCRLHKMQLKKERGGPNLTLLYQFKYVGHTPDGKTKKMQDEECVVLEVKVVFSAQESISALFKKHRDQLQLGLFVHGCKSGHLIVYRCNAEIQTIQDAKRHEVNVSKIEAHTFAQDTVWFSKFKPYVEAFYTEHLEWFFDRTFDVEQARLKVDSILSALKSKRKIALLKKQKLIGT